MKKLSLSFTAKKNGSCYFSQYVAQQQYVSRQICSDIAGNDRSVPITADQYFGTFQYIGTSRYMNNLLSFE